MRHANLDFQPQNYNIFLIYKNKNTNYGSTQLNKSKKLAQTTPKSMAGQIQGLSWRHQEGKSSRKRVPQEIWCNANGTMEKGTPGCQEIGHEKQTKLNLR